jgi:basic amino acid/polyamine antiporter, APA family
LSSTTYTVFTIWMAVAVLTYFGYGMRNSRLNKVDVQPTEMMH